MQRLALFDLDNTLVQAVIGADSGLIAVGSAGAPGSEDSAAWLSRDGREWQPQTLPDGLGGQGIQRLHAVAASGKQFVALGRSTTYSSDHLTLWRTRAE
ncbi:MULTISPECIES: hypothetical protein [unclassified Streptosporangium]|uniref:hypothetical protein n=1 Tax=unclassified Streptosporangium TaxID=2632669 RepID=UPI002E2DB701|nr:MULTISPECIES: hypothetical protein [unclassified Streptosporangium]